MNTAWTKNALVLTLVALPGCVVMPGGLGGILGQPGANPSPTASAEVPKVKDYFFPYSATWRSTHKKTEKSNTTSTFGSTSSSSEESATGTKTEEMVSFSGATARVRTSSTTTKTTKSGTQTTTKTATSSSDTDFTLNQDGSVTSKGVGATESVTIPADLFEKGSTSLKQGDATLKFTLAGTESQTVLGKSYNTYKFKLEMAVASSSVVNQTSLTLNGNMTGFIWFAKGIGQVKSDTSGTLTGSGSVPVLGNFTMSGTNSTTEELESNTP